MEILQPVDKNLLLELLAISWGWRYCRGRGQLLVSNIWRPIQDCAGELKSLLLVATFSPFCFSWATDILCWGLCELSPHLPPSRSSLFCFFSYEVLFLFLMSLVPTLHSFTTAWNYSDFIIKICTVSFFLISNFFFLFSNDIPQSRVQCLHKNPISNNLQQICCRGLCTPGDHPVCLLPLGFFEQCPSIFIFPICKCKLIRKVRNFSHCQTQMSALSRKYPAFADSRESQRNLIYHCIHARTSFSLSLVWIQG